jgi:ceramide glucosyltransferase
MGPFDMGLIICFAVPVLAFFVVIGFGRIKLRTGKDTTILDSKTPSTTRVEILVPVKGAFPGRESILKSLLEQDHESYNVIFILDTEDDPANSAVDRLCTDYSHARKVISGISLSCAQKNHNLIAGIGELRSDTEIIVFYDSTNEADPEFLKRLTDPIRTGSSEVVTTFRAFKPVPQSFAGICQAIYASFVTLLICLSPKPWGGGTAIRRTTFANLNVAEAWSRTVIDDLVLGKLLDRAGVKVRIDFDRLLASPLQNQSISGCMDYLERQILFPKFTNPGIWAIMTILLVNAGAAVIAATMIGLMFACGLVEPVIGWASWIYLLAMLCAGLAFKTMNPHSISMAKWLAYVLPCIVLIGFIFFRSVFRHEIHWHGRVYRPGSGGVVLETRFEME